jgi:hypothetical protein
MNPNVLAVKKAKAPPSGMVVSASHGRMRICVSEKKRDKSYFESLIHSLKSWPTVRRITANPVTGSLLIYSTLDKDELVSLLEKNGWLSITYPNAKRATPPRGPQSRRRTHHPSAGAPEISALVGMTLLGLAAWQGSRGKFLPAGLTLVFQASEFLRSWHLRPTAARFEPLTEGI